MAGYSTSTPPALMCARVGGAAPAIWSYRSVDAVATVRGANYITNAQDLGMKDGDIVFSYESDQVGPALASVSVVGEVSSDGATLYALTA
jgi:hypothetical protein